MPMSEAQKRTQIKHQRENYEILSVKVRKEEAAAFRAYAGERNTSMNAILKAYIAALLGARADTSGLVPETYVILGSVAAGLQEEAAQAGVDVSTLVGAILAEHLVGK